MVKFESVYIAKMFVSVFVSIECIEEYFKKTFSIPSHLRHKIEL